MPLAFWSTVFIPLFQVYPRWIIPVNAVLISLVVTSLLSLINIGSLVALNAIFVSGLLTSIAHAKWIAPGGRWRDTDGNYINAHAGSVTWDEVTRKYFWLGEYKTEEQEE